MTRARARRCAVAMIAVGVMAMTAASARASVPDVEPQGATVKDQTVYQEPGGICVIGRAEISDGHIGRGYLDTRTKSRYDSWITPWPDCGEYLWKDPGWITTRPIVTQDSPAGTCTDWGWQYNTVRAAEVRFTRDFNGIPGEGGCNGAYDYYGTWNGAYVYHNSEWRGAYVFSGWRWLPAWVGNNVGLEGTTNERTLPPQLPDYVDPVTMQVITEKVPVSLRSRFQPPPLPGQPGYGVNGWGATGVPAP